MKDGKVVDAVYGDVKSGLTGRSGGGRRGCKRWGKVEGTIRGRRRPVRALFRQAEWILG